MDIGAIVGGAVGGVAAAAGLIGGCIYLATRLKRFVDGFFFFIIYYFYFLV